MPTPLAQRLRAAMAGPPEVKQSDLAAACGIKPPSVSDWLSGRTKNLEGKNLLSAARFLSVNPNWLARGVGPMRDSSRDATFSSHSAESVTDDSAHTSRPPQHEAVTDQPMVLHVAGMVPVVGEIRGGIGGMLEEKKYTLGESTEAVRFWSSDEAAFALRVRNDALHPRYRAGEYIVVTPNVAPEQGSDVIVVCRDGRRLLKQLNWTRDDEVQLLAVTGTFEPETLAKADILVIQTVAGRVGRDALVATIQGQ